MARLRLTIDRLGLTARRLLLPIDLAKCPPEIFPVANGFTQPFDGEILLLYVVDRRKQASRRDVSEDELRRAEALLQRIGDEYLSPRVGAAFRVRVGIPEEEIRDEAAARNADLIPLPVFAPSRWRRLFGSTSGETARNVVIGAPCRVFVVDVRTRLNYFRRRAREKAWNPRAA